MGGQALHVLKYALYSGRPLFSNFLDLFHVFTFAAWRCLMGSPDSSQFSLSIPLFFAPKYVEVFRWTVAIISKSTDINRQKLWFLQKMYGNAAELLDCCRISLNFCKKTKCLQKFLEFWRIDEVFLLSPWDFEIILGPCSCGTELIKTYY